LLSRVRTARQDHVQGSTDHRLDERSGDAPDPKPGPGGRTRALRYVAGLSLRNRQREGGSPLHELAPPTLGLSTGDRPLDRTPALLRGAQGLERDHDSDRARIDREQPWIGRKAPRGPREQRLYGKGVTAITWWGPWGPRGTPEGREAAHALLSR